jgi:hypothetical protein
MHIQGRWSAQTWIDIRDVIRVIGEFNKDNNFTLRLDDDTEDLHLNDKAKMIIVEPQILIPTTQIVKSFPCLRKAYLNHQFKSLQGDINYALVLGNIVHAIF